MKKLSELAEVDLVKFVEARRSSTATIWAEIEKRYAANIKKWQNNGPEIAYIPDKKSKARMPRLTMGLETLNNFLTGRPGQPIVISSIDSPEARQFASDVQSVLVQKNRSFETKKKIKRALRNMYLTRLFVLKVVWNPIKNDVDVVSVNPKNVRFAPKASSESMTSYVLEDVEEPILDLLARFPADKHAGILAASQLGDADKALIENPNVKYTENWLELGDECQVVHIMNGRVISNAKNPYYDFQGVPVTRLERASLETKLAGKARRSILKGAKERPMPAEGEPTQFTDRHYFNHFSKPRKPYIFGTILDTEEKPVGDSDYFDQGGPLQENIDERARQIANNAKLMEGLILIDSEKTGLGKQDAARIQAEASGYIVAPRATEGIKRDTGRELPSFIQRDLLDSIKQLDDILGVPDTFRGVANQTETAQGRLLLREQAVGRLDELISLIDTVYRELYNWELQLMKKNYTEQHVVHILGATAAMQTVKLLQDDFDDMELHVVPGQTLPEDRVYKLNRAQDAISHNAISPVRYLEETGWENAAEAVKEAFQFQQNPLSVLPFTPEELNAMGTPPNAQPTLPGGAPAPSSTPKDHSAARAQQLAAATEILKSPEFQAKSPEEQARILDEIHAAFPELAGSGG